MKTIKITQTKVDDEKLDEMFNKYFDLYEKVASKIAENDREGKITNAQISAHTGRIWTATVSLEEQAEEGE